MLKHKRLVVLGGSRGIGFAVAELAAREGAAVVVVSSQKKGVDHAVARLPSGSAGTWPTCGRPRPSRSCSRTSGNSTTLSIRPGNRYLSGPT